MIRAPFWDTVGTRPLCEWKVGRLGFVCVLDDPLEDPGGNARAANIDAEANGSARLTAATAVVRQKWLCWHHLVLFYRVLEVCANAVCLSGMMWVLDPRAMVAPFVLLWYLPAARRAGSYTRPLQRPLLMFVCPDVSLLRLHPKQRSARRMYVICLLRVFLLLAIMPVCSKWSPLPQRFKETFMDSEAMDIFNVESTAVGGSTIPLVFLWAALGALVILVSLLWVALTIPMIVGFPCLGMPSPLRGDADADLLAQVDGLAAQVAAAALLPAAACSRALEALAARPGSRVRRVSTLSAVSAAVGSMTHVASEVFNVITFMRHGWFVSAVLLGATVFVSAQRLTQLTGGKPQTIMRELSLTLKRGVFTERLLAIQRADKGGQVMPALLLKVFGLPFAARDLYAGVVAAATIAASTFGMGKFLFQEVDLGVGGDDVDWHGPDGGYAELGTEDVSAAGVEMQPLD